jgi:DNA-directed RNA polymerase specialized sigma24 family protein
VKNTTVNPAYASTTRTETAVARKEAVGRIRAALAEVDDEAYLAALLQVEGLSSSAIGRILGVSHTHANRLAKKGLASIRNAITLNGCTEDAHFLLAS